MTAPAGAGPHAPVPGLSVSGGTFTELPGRPGAWLHFEGEGVPCAAAARLYSGATASFPAGLDGGFSFALLDPGNGGLLLGVDRFCEAPLYYSIFKWGAAWADSPDPLLRLPGADSRLDHAALTHFLAMRYIPSPMTAHRGVRKVPPGNMVLAGPSGVKVRSYWEIPQKPRDRFASLDEAAAALRSAAVRTLKKRLGGSGRAVCLLSGGIDSSAAAAFAAQAGVKLDTATLAPVGAARKCTAAAGTVARALGASHTDIFFGPPDGEFLRDMARAYPEPHADQAAVPLFEAARLLRGAGTALLTGDGGDENFAGHYRLRRMLDMAMLHRAPELELLAARLRSGKAGGRSARTVGNMLETVRRELTRIYFCDTGDFNSGERATLLKIRAAEGGLSPERTIEKHFYSHPGQSWLNRISMADLRGFLPECTVLRARTTAAAAGLRLVSPFLDHRLVEMSFDIPSEWRLPTGEPSKLALRRAAEGLLPRGVLGRKKDGLGVPAADWLGGPLGGFWRDTLLSGGARTAGLFKRAYLESLYAEHAGGRSDRNGKLWNLLMLELWLGTH